jgi:hypothetical protein
VLGLVSGALAGVVAALASRRPVRDRLPAS